ncbi:hypothetical protein [Natrinema sp. DC36]|uniref:hypothetical protein n=1 Tax=Natrinema sp. DC36 TaxID=2878680 RepID=UPI001CEFC299|nr:hypothetical protein [Natrinema sp. DC36]
MSKQNALPKYAVGFGSLLSINGLVGAIITNNQIFGFVSLVGILTIVLYLSIFGLILPLAQ